MTTNLWKVYSQADQYLLESQIGFLEEIALMNINNLSGSAAWLIVFFRNLRTISPQSISAEAFRNHRLDFLTVYMKSENVNNYSEGIINFLDSLTDALYEDTGNEMFLLMEE